MIAECCYIYRKFTERIVQMCEVQFLGGNFVSSCTLKSKKPKETYLGLR